MRVQMSNPGPRLRQAFQICLRDVLADPSGRSIDGTKPIGGAHRNPIRRYRFAASSPGSRQQHGDDLLGTSLIRFATEIQAKISKHSHKTAYHGTPALRFDPRIPKGAVEI
ncbi:MAG: hypothetical protein JO172_08530 [Hyphomicrobiales bacterium]|nr:hypothetical protein [Hyphomicrobiales bacterium]